MGNAIKGITVEIGGNATKLGQALEDVNKKSKSLQTELRGVNSLLKMDPSNVTLLAQKQDLLTQSIAETKSKLETLKEAQAQVQAQFERGEITEEQYRDLQREIILTEQKLEGLTDELKEFGTVGAQQVAQVGEKMQDVGGKIADVGKGFSIVSAGTGAILAGSISAFKELDEGYDTIVTKTGATGEALDSLNESANNVFGNMPTDMANVGVAIGEINTRFGYTGEQLETLSTQFIQFAEINGVDLNNSIGTVNKVLEQFNMDASEAGNVLDLITLKAQETGISADTLMNSIQDNGATFKDMGIGVNEAVVMLAQFEANGVNVETALKGLKKATTEYAEEGLSMEEALGATIDSIKNAKTETEALSIAQEVFGTKGANEMAKAIREGRISVDDLSASMNDYAGTVKSTYEGTLDPIDQSTVAMNNLKLAGSELATVLQSTFAPMLTAVVEKLKDLVAWFSNLSPAIQKIIVIVLSVVTALGPLLIVIGNIISSVGNLLTLAPKVVSAFNAMKTAFSALSAVFMANPIAIVIAILGALVTAFIYAYNHSEKFRIIVNDAFNKVKEVATTVVTALVNFFTVSLPNAFNSCKTFCSNFVASVVSFFATLPGKIWDAIIGAVNKVAQWGDQMLSTAKAKASAVVSGIVSAFTSLPSKMVSIGKSVIEGLMSGISSMVGSLYSSIKNTLSGLVDSAKSALGINSPSRVFAEVVGEQIPAGIAQGINANKGMATGAVKSMTDDFINQANIINGATINRQLTTTFAGSVGVVNNTESLANKLDGIYDRLGRLQIVLDTGTLVGETIDKIDNGLANRQLLYARGV